MYRQVLALKILKLYGCCRKQLISVFGIHQLISPIEANGIACEVRTKSLWR